MKKQITQKYMKVFLFSIIAIIFIWLILSYIFVFSGKDADENEPQYLIHRFEQYVSYKNGIRITDEGKDIIKENNLWAQIIDSNGKVIDSCNTNRNVPEKYNIFDIAQYTMNSDVIKNQTIFISKFAEKDYGIIIGCDISKISKWSIKITGGIKEAALVSLLILMSVYLIVGIIAGIILSRNISEPVNEIIENINYLEQNREIYITNKKNMYICVFESIKKLKRRLKSAEDERKKVELQRQEWIANISHDMKTPLTTIKGYAEIMSDEEYEISIEERKEYSAKIKRNVNVIENLIGDLNFSRLLKEGKIKIDKKETNICSLLKQCCEDIYIKYNEIVQFDFDDDKVFAFVDENLLRRVFVNILCNAFIHNGKEVNVLIRCIAEDRAIIEIIDDGKGMSEEELEQIFNRYYRGKASSEVEGSGLGLSIAQEIVKAHNGEILVESEIDMGTKFTIKI